ncbi:hypothetical protein CYMTET_28583 [Cymbomonas tetramitiformis]|uniref:Uncharacterized protein n=1 Tax=Cymbomonas tetramitiformis TaxID=36881 RepID=A0AAE0FMN8_9CHLO|nr:hypothetical protein CYMTET_28583 [Cymbomonas tetramitiformis]
MRGNDDTLAQRFAQLCGSAQYFPTYPETDLFDDSGEDDIEIDNADFIDEDGYAHREGCVPQHADEQTIEDVEDTGREESEAEDNADQDDIEATMRREAAAAGVRQSINL